MMTAYRVCHPYPGFDEFMMGMSKRKKKKGTASLKTGYSFTTQEVLKGTITPPLLM